MIQRCGWLVPLLIALSFASCSEERTVPRNAIVISVGFLPLLTSSLVPYQTVGFFLAAIMAASAMVTLVLLPSVVQLAQARLFSKTAEIVR